MRHVLASDTCHALELIVSWVDCFLLLHLTHVTFLTVSRYCSWLVSRFWSFVTAPQRSWSFLIIAPSTRHALLSLSLSLSGRCCCHWIRHMSHSWLFLLLHRAHITLLFLITTSDARHFLLLTQVPLLFLIIMHVTEKKRCYISYYCTCHRTCSCNCFLLLHLTHILFLYYCTWHSARSCFY